MDYETWLNSPELRDSVKRRLINWGWHFRGGHPMLDYPSHSSFTHPPRIDSVPPPEYIGPEDADEVERVICHEAQRDQLSHSFACVLCVEYVTRWMPQRTKAKKMGISPRTFRRRRDEAEFWFFEKSS